MGSDIRCEIACAVEAVAVAVGGRSRAFLSGRRERESEDVGIASAVGSDILVLWLWVWVWVLGEAMRAEGCGEMPVVGGCGLLCRYVFALR